MVQKVFEEGEAVGVFQVEGDGGFMSCEKVEGGCGWGGCMSVGMRAIDAEDGGTIVGEEEGREGGFTA